jgi:histidine triad (HIT) family protein
MAEVEYAVRTEHGEIIPRPSHALAQSMADSIREQHEMDACPFCRIVIGEAPATIVRDWFAALAIVPLHPVVDGHLLVIPKSHVADFTENPRVTALVMLHAAELAGESEQAMNLITSRGRAASQSVFHLHAHLVPRAENDGLALPWYSGKHSKRKDTHA